MRALPFWVAIVVICALAGCSATPPKSRLVSHDPILSRQGGVLLMVDACVQRDALGDTDDYFVITEAKSGAQAVLSALRKYVQDSGIPVRAEIIPFVCGARHSTDNFPIRVADSVGSPVRSDQQPLGVSAMIKNDPQYVNALSVVSTFAFERAAITRVAPKASDEDSPSRNAPTRVGMDDFRTAAKVLKGRTQASSVLFVGVLGISRSAGKTAVQSIGSFIVAMGSAIMTVGLGTDYYLIYTPGHQIDGMVIKGALIDLESGQLTWSNAVRVRGDPIDPKVMADPTALDLLFRDIMLKPVSVQPTSSSNP